MPATYTISYMRKMWQCWNGTKYPMSRASERGFVKKLRTHVTKHSKNTNTCTRDDTTTLMGILRSGSDLNSALSFAPGLRVNSLLAAYDTLDKRRAASEQAWKTLCANPTVTNFAKQKKLIVKLLPVIVKDLDDTVKSGGDIVKEIKKYETIVKASTKTAEALEDICLKASGNPAVLYGVVSRLYDPVYEYSAYLDYAYLSDRVATLSPSRVEALWKKR